MATSIAHNRYGRLDLIVILTSLVVGFSGLFLFFVDSTFYESSVRQELGVAREVIGGDGWIKCESDLRRGFRSYFLESGVYDGLHSVFIPEHSRGVFDKLGDEAYLHKVLINVQIFAYQMVYRFIALRYWAYLLFPLSACVIYNGFNKWRINRYQLGGAFTSKSRVYMKLVWLICLSFLLILVIPSFFPQIGFFLPAALMLGLSFVIGKFLSTFHKDL